MTTYANDSIDISQIADGSITAAKLATGTLLTGTDESYYLARAKVQMDAAGAAANWGWFFEEFNLNASNYKQTTNWTYVGSGGGTADIIAGDEAGGTIIMTTGATAGSILDIFSQNAMTGPTNTKPFYYVVKFAITTAVEANTKLLVGLHDGSVGITVGVCGPLSATQIVLQHSGNGGGSSSNLAAVDTASHIAELYGNGSDGKVYCVFDGAAAINVTPTALTKGRFEALVYNPVVATDRRLKLDYVGIAAGR